jgi:hypothetical protein
MISVKIVGRDVSLMGTVLQTVIKGVATFIDLNVRGPAGNYHLIFGVSDSDSNVAVSSPIAVTVSECPVGSSLDLSTLTCALCLPGMLFAQTSFVSQSDLSLCICRNDKQFEWCSSL